MLLKKGFITIFYEIVDFLIPPTCINCSSKITDKDVSLCHECWYSTEFIQNPICEICGYNIEGRKINSNLCVSCFVKKPNKIGKLYFSKKRSVCIYDKTGRNLIISFKYFDKIRIGKYMANMICKKYHDYIKESDIITFVPIHTKRMMIRKYNQSQIIAKNISSSTNIPILNNIVIKKVNNQSQFSLSQKQRMFNVKNVFQANKKIDMEYIKNKNILLVDDVMTTGATANACAKILKKMGAKKVHVITFATTKDFG